MEKALPSCSVVGKLPAVHQGGAVTSLSVIIPEAESHEKGVRESGHRDIQYNHVLGHSPIFSSSSKLPWPGRTTRVTPQQVSAEVFSKEQISANAHTHAYMLYPLPSLSHQVERLGDR
jgi:hypothetical protein